MNKLIKETNEMVATNDLAQSIKQIFISSPQIKEILSDIEECRSSSDGFSEPECMIVLGDTGSGKTTIIEKYLDENNCSEGSEGSIIPVLSTSLPPNATPITASKKLLADLGDPFAFQKGMDYVDLSEKIVKLTKNSGVELIIIDEFQHMIDRKSKEVLHSAADWLKMIIINSKIPVILFGMPYSVAILRANDQLSGRFEQQHKLEPFRVDTSESLKKYKTFLTFLDDALPFNKSSNLFENEVMQRIYAFSKGNMRRIRKLINKASRLAIKQDCDQIKIQHLKDAAYKVSSESCQPKNPFEVSINELNIQNPPKDIGWENYLQQEEVDVSLKDSINW